MYPFRVFISYAREDRKMIDSLVDVLQKIGIRVFWDKNIGVGKAFSDEIKGLIAHTHIFMPVITKNSRNRPWVHQETGFAIALKIPVLPVIITENEKEKMEPDIMIAGIQAIIIQNVDDLKKKFEEVNLENLVIPVPARPASPFDITEWPEKRTELLAKYANREFILGNYGCIRQRATFSSFYIPTTNQSKIWEQVDGDQKRSDYYHYLLSEERRALEQHAQIKGCRLIIHPTITLHFCGNEAIKKRLERLLEFLDVMPDDKIEVAISRASIRGNLTIVGDWFYAESRIPTQEGFRRTIFDFHPPDVLRYIKQFDEEFKQLNKDVNLDRVSSREYAIAKIQKSINNLSEK